MIHGKITELENMNEESIAELDMVNYGKDTEVITSSIYMNDQVKNLIEELVVEQIRHKEKQILCFNELMKIWYGENFISAPTKLDLQKESEILTIANTTYLKQSLDIYLTEKISFTRCTTLLRGMGNMRIIVKEFVQYILRMILI